MSKVIHQPTDKFFKRAFKELRVVREFLEQHLTSDILAGLNLDTLHIEKNTYVSEEFRHLETDLVYSVQYKEQPAYFYILCEMQSNVDRRMPIRLMGYLQQFYDLYNKQHPKVLLPLIFPIVIYAGEKPWNAPLGFFEMFGENSSRAKAILTKPALFVDIHRLEDDKIMQYRWIGLFEFVLKYRHFQDFQKFLETILPWTTDIEAHHGRDFAVLVINFIMNELNADDKTVFVQTANQYLSDTLRGDIMTIAQQFRLEGLQQGLQQGFQQGRQEGQQELKHALARKLLAKKNMTIEEVAALIELDIKEVIALQKSLTEH